MINTGWARHWAMGSENCGGKVKEGKEKKRGGGNTGRDTDTRQRGERLAEDFHKAFFRPQEGAGGHNSPC